MIDIVYKPYVLSSHLTGNTTDYSVISAITSGIYISSGFTFNLTQFDMNQISKLDIIDNIINYINYGINKYMLNVIIVDYSGETNIINQIGDYCIKISYQNEDIEYFILRAIYDVSNNMSVILVDNIYNNLIITPINTTTTLPVFTTTTTTMPIIYDINIYYMPVLSSNLTGNTINYSGASSAITSGIYISSGFTFNLNGFDNNKINRLDIINNVINYVNNDINKYSLDILIVGSGETNVVTQTGEYCIEISYNNNALSYLMMKVIYDILSDDSVILIKPTINTVSSNVDISPTVNLRTPIIYYNSPISGTTWVGSGTTIPYNVFLDFIHNGVSGWTLDSLKILFISGITDCVFYDISLSDITFILYKNGSTIPLSGIVESGIYKIFISVTNSVGNTTINIIQNIKVDDEPPVIVYKYNVIMNITGNTNDYSGASSAITSGIYIESGFTFNLNGFDHNEIDRLDIIENIVNYVYDDIDFDINKYMLNILLSSKHTDDGPIIYNTVTLPGPYCIKIFISDSSGNEIINYFLMNVVYDVSTYSEGYWQDDKVWIDSILWLDHPIIY